MRRLSLHQPAIYRIEIVGHLDVCKATWFEGLALTNGFDEDGNPVTTIAGEVLDQAMLHGLIAHIRDLGIPLLSVTCIEHQD